MSANANVCSRVKGMLCAVVWLLWATAAAADPPLVTPTAMLDGALHCPATFDHPGREPVLLVHGATVNYQESWSWNYAPALTSMGYDVCGVDLPERGGIDLQVSTEYVVHAIDRIHAWTGRKVDVVGHSEGSVLTRWAVKWWPRLWDKTDDVVLLASPAHGTQVADLLCALPCSAPAWQARPGSNWIAALNAGDETPGPLSYTSVYTELLDELVVPAASADIAGAENLAIQDLCPLRPVTHAGMVYDAAVFRLVLDAVANPGPADFTRLGPNPCSSQYLPGVTALDVLLFTGTGIPRFSFELITTDKLTAEPPLMSYAQ
ncbi:esterase/lipase family protein [Lysobacter arvi]|uniref:Alpha/beta fold hydrolase n=1 Tax=Lysobacter arvi TaxID=3038776 RepID=A0ABU1CE24_9GAMM|nr:hypothetical protein [Lysobacter arvi]MDR0183443.1 hypothetical protein [Lysobacter arvi]